MSKKSSNSEENSSKTKIDKKFINKIYKELLSSEKFNIDNLDLKKVNKKPLIYLFSCELIKSHSFLKFGKGEKTSRRIKNHLDGKLTILNKKISRDVVLQSKANFLCEEKKDDKNKEKRKDFIKKYCSLQYLILNDIYDLYLEVYRSNELHKNWYNYWKKIYPDMEVARRIDYDDLERRDPTYIIEKPIEQILYKDLRYIGKQPPNNPEVIDWDKYNL